MDFHSVNRLRRDRAGITRPRERATRPYAVARMATGAAERKKAEMSFARFLTPISKP